MKAGLSPRRAVLVALGCCSLFASALFATAPGAGATSAFGLGRLAGADRYGTSALVAERAFAVAPTVILATGATYPDALAASFLAGNLVAPILLTTPDLPMSPSTTAALTNLGVRNILILGGTDAISSAEQAQLSHSYVVTRVSGASRYDTMAAVDQYAGTSVGTHQGLRTAFLATGEDFPDAIGAGPIAYAERFPIILTASATLSPQAAATLTALGIQQVLILGGTSAVSATVQAQVTAMGISILTRVAGVDRSDTSAQLADYAIANFGFKATTVNLASGDEAYGGADALSTGPLGGSEDPVVTVVSDSVTNLGKAVSFAAEHVATLTTGLAVGGAGPLSDALLSQFAAAAGGTVTGGSGSASGPGPTGSAGVACGTPPTVGAGGSTGESNQTILPELTAVSLIGLTTAVNATPANPAGTLLRFSFDEPVTGSPVPAHGDFILVNANGTVPAANAAALSTPVVEPGNPSSVDVLFPGINTQALFDGVGLASVVPGAVHDVNGNTNPDASAVIGGHLNLTQGKTDAPDLQSYGGFRQGLNPGQVMVDLTFDCSATTVAAAGYHIVLTDNSVTNCTGPAPGNQNPSGGNAAGGNGTTVITVSCPTPVGTNNPALNGVLLTPTEVARFFIDAGTLTNTVSGAFNPVESVGTSPTSGTWVAPDLTSATPMANQPAGDQVVYNFDLPIHVPPLGGFDLFTNTGAEILGAATAIASPYNGSQNSVLVTFPAGTLLNVVGAFVPAGAVTGAVGLNLTNQPQSYPILGTTQTTTTTTPDFVSAAFGAAPGTVIYTFDKPPGAITPALFHLYLQNGTVLNGTAAAAPVGNTVTITAFSGVITGAVLATVDAGAAGNAAGAGGAV